MSKNIWQIRKQNEILQYGKSVTSRVKAYTKRWENICYKDGIPDSLPVKLLFSGRAPSYQAIAICMLRNDLLLKSLGLSVKYNDRQNVMEKQIKAMKKCKESRQQNLFE